MNQTLGLSLSNLEDPVEHPLSMAPSAQEVQWGDRNTRVNFSSHCWRQVNGALARLGFDMLMDPGMYTNISLEEIVCDEFMKVLHSLENARASVKRLEKRLHEADLKESK